MKIKLLLLLLAAFAGQYARAAEATPEQIKALAPKFTVADCALWRGGEDHQNDHLTNELVAKVEVILEFLNNLELPEALRAIELYCATPKGALN